MFFPRGREMKEVDAIVEGARSIDEEGDSTRIFGGL